MAPAYKELEFWGEGTWGESSPGSPADYVHMVDFAKNEDPLLSIKHRRSSSSDTGKSTPPRPPLNAEYVLYLFLKREERDVMIGDLVESYRKILERFNKRRADIWFYKQVAGSMFPLLRRTLLRIGALVWLGRMLRRLIS